MWFRRIFGAKTNQTWRPISAASSKAVQDAWSLPPGIFRQLNRLRLNTGRWSPGQMGGVRPGQQRRPDMDFREHRAYAPGDDVRFVDWRASARQEHIFIKQGEHLKNTTVHLVLDCSASMDWGSPPRSHAVHAVAAVLGYLALAHGDRLVVLPVSGAQPGPAPLGPITGKGQFPLLLKYLRSLPFEGQADLGPALASLARRAPRGGLVFVLSDLLVGDDFASALPALPRPTWQVAFFHLLHPAELEPSLRGDFDLQDAETGQKRRHSVSEASLQAYKQHLQDWLAQMEEACLERKALYTLIPTQWNLENEILPHLRRLQVVRPL